MSHARCDRQQAVGADRSRILTEGAAALRRNYLIAYVGHQAAPGEPMTVLHRACLDWSAFVRTSGWHGIDAATNAGTTYGM